MARKFTPLYTSIWQNDDFRALHPLTQAAYFTLISQPNINSVGLLPITERRWANCSTGWTAEAFLAAIAELERAAFVICDHDSEELLIRTFVQWDGGANHAMRRKSIAHDASGIQSVRLRHAVGTELTRLGVEHDLPTVPYERPECLSDSDSSASGIATEEPSVLVLTLRNQNREPEPELGTENQNGERVAVATKSTPTQTIIAAWIDHCTHRPPGAVIGKVSKQVKKLIDEGIDPRFVERGLATWASKNLSESLIPNCVNDAMNSGGFRPTQTGPATAKAAGWMDLGVEQLGIEA